jgi:hypothetical protein
VAILDVLKIRVCLFESAGVKLGFLILALQKSDLVVE